MPLARLSGARSAYIEKRVREKDWSPMNVLRPVAAQSRSAKSRNASAASAVVGSVSHAGRRPLFVSGKVFESTLLRETSISK